MTVNPTKGKQLTNMRSSGADAAINLTPPQELTLPSLQTPTKAEIIDCVETIVKEVADQADQVKVQES